MLKSKIREAHPGDLDELVRLCEEHAAYEEASVSFTDNGKKDLASLLFSQKHIHCLVAEHQGILMGYTTFTIQYATWTASRYVYMDCLYLREEARGKGTGKLLMQHIAKFMKAHDLKQAQWQTPATNEKAIKFYRQLGAVDLCKSRFFWKP